ncbi:enoyl-CoA hydratase/isomerase family protein [Massilia sp. W12]|uniref:enoyl-CoA hydratase/isomerase family protein n=1 Tax=Massilia sp. W12 TaxID=3126507 RepID=UPI0030D29C89
MNGLHAEVMAGAHGAIGVLTLQRPHSLHALDVALVDALFAQLQDWQTDARIAAVFLQAQGDKAFCAGGDLHGLYDAMRAHHASAQAADACANQAALNFFSHEYRLDYLLHRYRKPLLCWGNGLVLGGGLGLLAGAAFRVVTEHSKLAMPEAAIGLFPDVGASWFLARIPRRLGRFLAISGAQLQADDICAAGLADYRLPHQLRSRVLESMIMQTWTADAAHNHGVLARLLHTVSMQDGLPAQPGPLQIHASRLQLLCQLGNAQEAAQALLEWDEADAWLRCAQDYVRSACPAMLELAWRIQDAARHLSLAAALRLELGVALRCAQGPDFVEGIRALLIDKDRQPQWRLPSAAMADWLQPLWPAAQHPLHDLEQIDECTV